MFNLFKKKKTPIEGMKTEPIEDYNDIAPISNYFHNETGITFDKQISILKNKVTSFCKQRNIHSFEKLLKDIESKEQIKQELIDYLTTNETYFYREFKQIAELVELVKKSNKRVEILCAPSSSGEEVYSIAIALVEAKIPSTSFHIIGIDINSDAIFKAQNAVYKERNIRKLSPQIVDRYFTKNQNSYALNKEIKSLVSFKISNIFNNSFKNLGKFDYIFSRNMLIYFDKETKLKAKSILESMRKNSEQDIFFGHADLF